MWSNDSLSRDVERGKVKHSVKEKHGISWKILAVSAT
jgi:desulfoferrodoxin (superoxide reductase-like protein)